MQVMTQSVRCVRKMMLALSAFAIAFGCGSSVAQTSIADQPWSGWAQCQITVQGPNSYNYTETQTWSLAGSQPTVQGAIRIHPANWKVTGQGSFSKTSGAQTYSAQWTTNATQSGAPIALFIRASDGMLVLKSWHSQLRALAAMTGTQTVSINGIVQSQSAVSFPAYEWAVPGGQVSSTTASITGSNTTPTNGSAGPMQPGGSQGTAACSWQFAAGSNSVALGPPSSGRNSPTSSGTTTSGGSTPGTTTPGSGTSGSGTPGSGTPGTGSNPGGTSSTGGGQTQHPNTLPTPVNVKPVSPAVPLGSCPPTPSPVNDIAISSPYCVHQGQQNVSITLTAVSPFQWPQGSYDPSFGSSVGPGSGMNGVSATWNSPTSVTYVMSFDANAVLGPHGAWITFAPPGQGCCTILSLHHFVTIIP